jgi:hypothetical protein
MMPCFNPSDLYTIEGIGEKQFGAKVSLLSNGANEDSNAGRPYENW